MQIDRKLLFKVLNEILAVPTAPFKEKWLIETIVKKFKGRKYFKISQDKVHNLIIQYKPPRAKDLKMALHAHLDHPGFIFEKMQGKRLGIIEALGGVPENCKGATIRFFSSSHDPGTCAKIKRYKKTVAKQEIVASVSKSINKGSIGMWDFPHLRIRGKWLEGRAFDDNLGSAILVYLLEYFARKKGAYSFTVIFTRAEEVGYIGALELLKNKRIKLPKNIVTLEMPRAGMGLIPGAGVMLRAGDRYINFNPSLLQYFESIAIKIKKRDKNFNSQRRLGLFGGTEVTSFDLYDYTSGALCLAVDNGHNINRRKNGKPAPEKVHLDDLISMVKMLHSILITPYSPASIRSDLKKRVEIKYRSLRKRLSTI